MEQIFKIRAKSFIIHYFQAKTYQKSNFVLEIEESEKFIKPVRQKFRSSNLVSNTIEQIFEKLKKKFIIH